MKIILITLLILIAAFAIWFVRHQHTLRQRSELMNEAIRNRDFTFRLPTDGLLPGERTMQESLNLFGTIIKEQIQQSEVRSWEKLTRVLTHEIMNSVAPVASISQAMLQRNDVRNTPIEEGIRAIYSTATHLSSFVDGWRKVSQLQKPVIESVDIATIVAEVCTLFPEIEWHNNIPTDAKINTDPNLLHQIFVNIIKNAKQANAKKMAIEHDIATRTLTISNDGDVIPPEVRDSIFVPFFTTKRDGNGIGLSLSRQILTQQGATIELLDVPQTSYTTTFAMQFVAR